MKQNSITVTYIFSGNFIGNFLSGEIIASKGHNLGAITSIRKKYPACQEAQG